MQADFALDREQVWVLVAEGGRVVRFIHGDEFIRVVVQLLGSFVLPRKLHN